MERIYEESFQYTHKNPYHERLAEFSEFVLRDHEGESFKGRWNQDVFKKEAPLAVEVGAGFGQFMRSFCQDYPQFNFVGLDFRFKRGYELAQKLGRLNLTSMRYLRARGERLGHLFGEGEIDKLFYFFPDPWPKKRHHKKRLFQAPFLAHMEECLKTGGQALIKTDHDGYYQWMLEELAAYPNPWFKVEMATWDLYKEEPHHFLASYQTKFEKIFLKQGIKIKALVLTKV